MKCHKTTWKTTTNYSYCDTGMSRASRIRDSIHKSALSTSKLCFVKVILDVLFMHHEPWFSQLTLNYHQTCHKIYDCCCLKAAKYVIYANLDCSMETSIKIICIHPRVTNTSECHTHTYIEGNQWWISYETIGLLNFKSHQRSYLVSMELLLKIMFPLAVKSF